MRIRNLTANCIWLTAWGLTRKHPHVWWPGCHRPGKVRWLGATCISKHVSVLKVPM
jgi:hypothetical protein